jgi:hypothetical protein
MRMMNSDFLAKKVIGAPYFLEKSEFILEYMVVENKHQYFVKLIR